MTQLGDKGQEVAEIQKLLSLAGYDLIIDASFGKKTLLAVKSFQKKHRLLVDGIVGEKTLSILKEGKVEHLQISDVIDYANLEVITTCQMPDNQYIKQITPKSQIFIHFTAGRPSAKSTIDYWNGNESQVSTAYVIDGNSGLPYQAFNPDYWGFHLGIKGTNGKLDKASIGIEICAFGPLKKKGNDFYAWPKKYTTKVSPDNVYTLEKPFKGFIYYYKYTDKQLENLEKLLVFLIERYNIKVQDNFDINWLDYNQELIDKCLPGIWSHSNVRKDKYDTYPDERLFEILNRISKRFN